MTFAEARAVHLGTLSATCAELYKLAEDPGIMNRQWPKLLALECKVKEILDTLVRLNNAEEEARRAC